MLIEFLRQFAIKSFFMHNKLLWYIQFQEEWDGVISNTELRSCSACALWRLPHKNLACQNLWSLVRLSRYQPVRNPLICLTDPSLVLPQKQSPLDIYSSILLSVVRLRLWSVDDFSGIVAMIWIQCSRFSGSTSFINESDSKKNRQTG